MAKLPDTFLIRTSHGNLKRVRIVSTFWYWSEKFAIHKDPYRGRLGLAYTCTHYRSGCFIVTGVASIAGAKRKGIAALETLTYNNLLERIAINGTIN